VGPLGWLIAQRRKRASTARRGPEDQRQNLFSAASAGFAETGSGGFWGLNPAKCPVQIPTYRVVGLFLRLFQNNEKRCNIKKLVAFNSAFNRLVLSSNLRQPILVTSSKQQKNLFRQAIFPVAICLGDRVSDGGQCSFLSIFQPTTDVLSRQGDEPSGA